MIINHLDDVCLKLKINNETQSTIDEPKNAIEIPISCIFGVNINKVCVVFL